MATFLPLIVVSLLATLTSGLDCRLSCKDKHNVIWSGCKGNNKLCIYKHPGVSQVRRLEFTSLLGAVDVRSFINVNSVKIKYLKFNDNGLCSHVITDKTVHVNDQPCPPSDMPAIGIGIPIKAFEKPSAASQANSHVNSPSPSMVKSFFRKSTEESQANTLDSSPNPSSPSPSSQSTVKFIFRKSTKESQVNTLDSSPNPSSLGPSSLSPSSQSTVNIVFRKSTKEDPMKGKESRHDETTDKDLTISLSVSIPSSVIIVTIIVLFKYLRRRRTSMHQQEELSTPMSLLTTVSRLSVSSPAILESSAEASPVSSRTRSAAIRKMN